MNIQFNLLNDVHNETVLVDVLHYLISMNNNKLRLKPAASE